MEIRIPVHRIFVTEPTIQRVGVRQYLRIQQVIQAEGAAGGVTIFDCHSTLFMDEGS